MCVYYILRANKRRTPSCFTPFGLRTEERAERRKKARRDSTHHFFLSAVLSLRHSLYWFLVLQKLEEKFKTMVEPEKERSVEKEESKLRQRLCFKAKPLPNFYKQRPKTTDQTKKVSSLSLIVKGMCHCFLKTTNRFQ